MSRKINQVFDLLDKWRHFPAYALERRADIYFALYIPDIFKAKHNATINYLLPEFPIQIGSIYGDVYNKNQSKKIDFVAIDESNKQVYFIELKTDMRSRRGSQDDYLLKAKEAGIPRLVDGILKIYKATKQRGKYRNLLNDLITIGWLTQEEKKYNNICKPYELKVIYIQPENCEDDKHIISFDDMINQLQTYNDEFSKRFVQSLEEWKRNPNNL